MSVTYGVRRLVAAFDCQSGKAATSRRTPNIVFGQTQLNTAIVKMTLLFAPSKQAAQRGALVFTHITVIDATGAPPSPDMTVVIVGDRIFVGLENDAEKLPRSFQSANIAR